MEHEHRIAAVDLLALLDSVEDHISIRYIANRLAKRNPDVAESLRTYLGTYLQILDDEQLDKEIA